MTHSYPQMKIRLPPAVHAHVKEMAIRQERSLNAHIVFLLRQEMEKEKASDLALGKQSDASHAE
ncbi:MAG: toxin-antitoxin system HicB family antitoxin [Acetobacter papayae]|uniref:toxin-antitoxin system HicB family antitoxin n=1 Tax=Acetobacter papayae TaxID=1076592 RepID=UPI0039ECAD8B